MVKEASAIIRKLLFTSMLLVLMFFCVPAFAQLEPAKTIPNFTFYSLDDHPFTQKNLKQSPKILFLFFDATCTHCQYETQLISSHYKDFTNTVFYFISMDKKPQVINFMKTYGKQLYGKSNVTVLVDANRQFIQKFMPSQFPALYIYNSSHQLLKYWDTPVAIEQVMTVIYAQ